MTLSGKYSKLKRRLKDKEEKQIIEVQEQRDGWLEHFEKLLNRPALLKPSDIEAAFTGLLIDVTSPTIEEIRMAIGQIKCGKAAGNIPSEVLMPDVGVTATMLCTLFKNIWEEEQVSTDWKERYLIMISKIGDLRKCENHRDITLLSVPANVFNRVLLNRIKDSVDAQLCDQQFTFRKHRGCMVRIATIQIIVEQSVECHSSLYIILLKCVKVFDIVDRRDLRKHP